METQESIFKIRPPDLEEAGLEDCALSPDSIKQAFLKAATSLDSAFHGNDDGEAPGTCIHNPGPSNGAPPDSLVGIYPEPGTDGGPCGSGKDGLPELYGDKVVDGYGGFGNSGGTDRVLAGDVPESDAGGGCTDGLQGLEIEKAEEKGGYERDEEEEEVGPILAEASV